MRPRFSAIIDDRELPPPEVERLIGDIQFGDLLRRRRRYLDELVAAVSGADDVTLLRTDEEADQLVRRIEAATKDTLWLRLPAVTAPLDMVRLNFLVRKMRYALEPLLLSDVFDDEAPVAVFSQHAAGLISSAPGKERRSFLLQLAEEAPVASHQVDFIDLRQPESLRQFLSGATEPREFNELWTDRGVFIKKSNDVAKMRAESGFFEIAPPEMRRFLLPTFGYEESDGAASYCMEHLRVPDAALQFMLGAFSHSQFEQLMDQFFAFVDARERESLGFDAVRDCGEAQILQKMKDRLDDFGSTETGSRIDAHLIAGGIDGGVRGLERRALPLIKTALSSGRIDYLAFSHGDPCLSNILYDSRIALLRLIDPRGATRRDEALMHPLYDIAKFSHSVCGGYDFVNNDLFSIEVDATLGLELQRHRGGSPDWVKKSFRKRLETDGWCYREVRAVEASLFLSMLPLHLDHERKLLGFALIADEIITELEENDD